MIKQRRQKLTKGLGKEVIVYSSMCTPKRHNVLSDEGNDVKVNGISIQKNLSHGIHNLQN